MGKLFYPKCSQTNSRDVKVSIGTLHGYFLCTWSSGWYHYWIVSISRWKSRKIEKNAPFLTSCHPASNYYKSAWCSRRRNIKETKLWTFYTVKTDFHAARHFLVFLPRVPISVEFMWSESCWQVKCKYHNHFKKNDRHNVNKYIGISILAVAGKILALVMLNRMRDPIAETVLPESQNGFRPKAFESETCNELSSEIAYHNCVKQSGIFWR